MVIDNPAYFDAMAETHGIEAALIVTVGNDDTGLGYGNNNDFVAQLSASGEFGWIRPTYFLRVSELTVAKLEELAASPTPWVGITMYTGTLDPPENTTLHTVDPAAWSWLAARKWFVSVNDGCTGRSDASGWPHWLEVVRAHPELRLTCSHLGLPDSFPADSTPTLDECRERIAEVLALAEFPGPRVRSTYPHKHAATAAASKWRWCGQVKLSGFYALTTPSHAYPHTAAFGYVQLLLEAFGAER